MKTAIVYKKNDHKLSPEAYSWTYRGMFNALIKRFQPIHINKGCNYQDIDADLIIFFDPHSSHHITIDGIEKHDAIKIEYFNDPHQMDYMGKYKNGDFVRKLGSINRVNRANDRGVDYIICPYKSGYYRFIAPFIGDEAEKMLIHFPIAPDERIYSSGSILLKDRKPKVLGNGATWASRLPCYVMREWAHKQDCIEVKQHWLRDKDTPQGGEFGSMLSEYPGALALCEFYPVPKYFEIPLAGCVTFAQYHQEYEELGFKDGEHCIYVDKNNFIEKVKAFTGNPEAYQHIATAGRELVLSKYTARHFADHIYNIALKATCKSEAVGV